MFSNKNYVNKINKKVNFSAWVERELQRERIIWGPIWIACPQSATIYLCQDYCFLEGLGLLFKTRQPNRPSVMNGKSKCSVTYRGIGIEPLTIMKYKHCLKKKKIFFLLGIKDPSYLPLKTVCRAKTFTYEKCKAELLKEEN